MKQGAKLIVYNWLTKVLPATSLSQRLRIACLKWAGVKLGRNVEIGDGVVFRGDGKISIGDNVRIYDDVYILCKKNAEILIGSDGLLATRVYVECGGRIEIGCRTSIMQDSLLTANCESKLTIGTDCQIAHWVSLKTSHHNIEADNVCIAGKERFDDIRIGNGVWLCAGVVVLPGVSVGDKVVAAAGAVLTKSTPSNVLLAGVPAIVKKKYSSTVSETSSAI